MGINQTYNFDNTSNFTKSNTVVTDKARLALIPNPGQLFSEDFADDTGFTYDSDLAEFVGGVLRQKDQSPSNSVIAALYDSTLNANWNKQGSLTANLNGTPTIVSNRLQCFGSNGVSYDVNNSPVGTIKIKYTPNYTGSPSTNINIFSLRNTSNNNSRIQVTHSPSGNNFRILIDNNSSVAVLTTQPIGGTLNFVQGTTYEIEFNWDSVNGAVRIFLNGNLHGTLNPGPWSHGSGSTRLHIGAYTTTYNVADASFEDIVYFNSVQHTTSYIAEYSLPSFLYLGSKVDGPSFTYTGVGTVLSVDDGSITETGNPRYIVGGQYYNGTEWVLSNGTYSQANDFVTALNNFDSLNVVNGGVLPWSVVFTDSNVQSSVDEFAVEVTGQKYSPLGYVEPLQGINVESLISYTHSAVETLDSYIRVILKIDGQLKYWDGTNWVNSDGTELESNTLNEVNNNLPSLDFGSNSTVFVRWLLITSLDNQTPELETSSIEYDFGGIETKLTKCLIYGYYKDISDNPVQGATVKFSLSREKGVYQEANKNIVEAPVTVTTDENGYFEVELVRSSEYSVGGTYRIEINKKDGGLNTTKRNTSSDLTFTVPDADQKDITDLLPV